MVLVDEGEPSFALRRCNPRDGANRSGDRGRECLPGRAGIGGAPHRDPLRLALGGGRARCEQPAVAAVHEAEFATVEAVLTRRHRTKLPGVSAIVGAKQGLAGNECPNDIVGRRAELGDVGQRDGCRRSGSSRRRCGGDPGPRRRCPGGRCRGKRGGIARTAGSEQKWDQQRGQYGDVYVQRIGLPNLRLGLTVHRAGACGTSGVRLGAAGLTVPALDAWASGHA